MSDPNSTNGPSSGSPRDPSGPASDEFGYSSDATQLWGPEEPSQPSPSQDVPAEATIPASPAQGATPAAAEPVLPADTPPVAPDRSSIRAC